MTTSEALAILGLSTLTDSAGHVVRDTADMGNDADLAECEEAARLLGVELEEDDDGDLRIAA